MNIKLIIEAWIIANNPTEKQKKLGNDRLKVCENCPALKDNTKKRINFFSTVLCSECGCPITKKIYTNSFNPCPLGKWEDIDQEYFPKQKKTKTLF